MTRRERTKPAAIGGRRLPRAVWLLSWVSFFADVSGEMIYPLLPLFLIGVLGSTRAQLGVIEGTAVLTVALLSTYAGFHSDRMGKRVPWIRWGYGLPVLGKTVISLAMGWPLVFGGRLLDRFGKGLRGAPRDALIADAVSKEQRGRAFGLHRALDTAGALSGVVLSALLLWWLTGTPHGGTEETAASTPAWVYRTVFAVAAGLGLASFALTFLVKESRSAGAKEVLHLGSVPPAQAPAAARDETGPLGLPRSYWSALAILVLFSLANSSDAFLLLRASDLGYSPWMVVLVYALYNATYALCSYPAGVLSDRFGRWSVIAVGWALYAGMYAGVAYLPASQAWGLWPLMAGYGVYMALTDGVGKALIADHAPPARRGAAMGIFYSLTGFTTLLASVAVGIVWDRYGHTPAFLIGAGFAVAALLALGVRLLQSPAQEV